jgi:hypothetical protein
MRHGRALTIAGFLRATTTPVTLPEITGASLPLPNIKDITVARGERGGLKLLLRETKDGQSSDGDLRRSGEQSWKFGCQVLYLTVALAADDSTDTGTLTALLKSATDRQYELRLLHLYGELYRTPKPEKECAEIFEALSRLSLGQSCTIHLSSTIYLETRFPRAYVGGQTGLQDFAQN